MALDLLNKSEIAGNPLKQTLEHGEETYLSKLPYIVIIIDEFADIMMTVGKKIEYLIIQLTQKSRAAGIHLIIATQRPSVKIFFIYFTQKICEFAKVKKFHVSFNNSLIQ